MSTRGKSATEKFRAAATTASASTHFRLYIAGPSDRSTRAIRNARDLCDTHYPGAFELEVIDILQQPSRARTDQVLAVPMLIKHQPLPTRRFVGDLSDIDVLLTGLGLPRA